MGWRKQDIQVSQWKSSHTGSLYRVECSNVWMFIDDVASITGATPASQQYPERPLYMVIVIDRDWRVVAYLGDAEGITQCYNNSIFTDGCLLLDAALESGWEPNSGVPWVADDSNLMFIPKLIIKKRIINRRWWSKAKT